MTTQATSTILNSAIASSQELLTQYSLSEDLLGDLTTAFGTEYDSDAAQELITQWQTGEFSAFPEFEIRSAEEINGANGAYSADTNKIYISEEYLLANADDVKAITDLVLEEYGHYVDASINTVDAAGDEGAIFSGLVQGETFTASELQQLQLENDKAVITLDGQEIAIEQREASVTNLAEGFSLKGDETNLHIGDFNGDGRDDILRQRKDRNRAQILFADRNGDFFVRNRVNLPEDFRLEGGLTNIHVGDFNGDGLDDFLRQEKGRFDNDNKNTANIFTSNGDGTFSKVTLAEGFSLKGDETNLHIGDFNGDGRDDILRQEKGRLDNDNRSTAQILFADRNGDFFSRNIVNLPENFEIEGEIFNLKGDLTDLSVGDFNGDGLDDFIRQVKSDGFDGSGNNHIFFSNGDDSFRVEKTEFIRNSARSNGNKPNTFSDAILDVADFNGDGKDDILVGGKSINSLAGGGLRIRESTTVRFSLGDGKFRRSTLANEDIFNNRPRGDNFLFEGFDIRRDVTNLHAGDFNGDDVSDFLRQEKGELDNDNLDTAQIFSNIGFDIVDLNNDLPIIGGVGNDSIEGLSSSNFNFNGGKGDDTLVSGVGQFGGGNHTLNGGDGDDILDARGDGNDFLDGGSGNDILDARGGNDVLEGGDGDDKLNGGSGADNLNGGSGQDTLRGNSGTDTLNGGDGDDFLDGGNQKDTLLGGLGSDVLKGGGGDDFIDGGDGLNVASYQRNMLEFDITLDDDGNIIGVTHNNQDDKNEGTDTLTNISLLSFGGTRFGGNSQRNIVQAVADVSSDAQGNSIFVAGGKSDATNFTIDLKGKTGLTLDFNTQQLAEFINTITLPDEDIEIARLSANLAFDAIGGIFGSIPGFGAIGSTALAMTQTLSNYAFDLAQIDAQKEAAVNAVRDFDSFDFGSIDTKTRDLVVIEDFKIGVDTLLLPSIPPGNVAGFTINNGNFRLQDGKFHDGALIEITNGQESSELVFIANKYDTLANSNFPNFVDQIDNLFQNSGGSSPIIGTFNPTPIPVRALQNTVENRSGSFAGDHIIGGELPSRGADNPGISGRFELFGLFGDDFIQGASQDDTLYGGDNDDSDESLTNGALTYEDDGFDVLQGGKGDDLLKGGTGNDTLDGGGFTYDGDLNVTGVIVGDGTDTLTGGSGNDTFVFNTPNTGIDVITDFTVFVDKIQINDEEFGATDKSEFSFDQSNGALSFGSQQFATLENFADLPNFDVNTDIVFKSDFLSLIANLCN